MFQGEREMAADNNMLGQFDLVGGSCYWGCSVLFCYVRDVMRYVWGGG